MQVAGTEPTPLLTRRGTRRGSNWADLTFAVILKTVLACRDKLRTCTFTPRLPWNGSKNVFDLQKGGDPVDLGEVVWADDLAASFTFPTADAVEPGLMTESGIMSDSFQSYAMRLNYGPTKTAAIAACRGPGARDAGRRLFGRQHITVLRENATPESVPIVARYRHVGVAHGPEGSIKEELRQRVAEAWAAYRQGRKKLYRSRQLATDAKVTLWRTMVLSRLFYGAGSWPPLPVTEKRLLQSTILGMLRQITVPCHSEEQRVHQCEVCAKAESACPAAMLFAERLRYLRQMVAAGPPALWALLKLDPSGCLPYQEALVWLQSREPRANALGHPQQSWQLWASGGPQSVQGHHQTCSSARCLEAAMPGCLVPAPPLAQGFAGQDLRPTQQPALADLVEARTGRPHSCRANLWFVTKLFILGQKSFLGQRHHGPIFTGVSFPQLLVRPRQLQGFLHLFGRELVLQVRHDHQFLGGVRARLLQQHPGHHKVWKESGSFLGAVSERPLLWWARVLSRAIDAATILGPNGFSRFPAMGSKRPQAMRSSSSTSSASSVC